jgi:hypothetical protein
LLSASFVSERSIPLPSHPLAAPTNTTAGLFD